MKKAPNVSASSCFAPSGKLKYPVRVHAEGRPADRPMAKRQPKTRERHVVAGFGDQQRIVGPRVIGNVLSIFPVVGSVDVGRLDIDMGGGDFPDIDHVPIRTAAGSVFCTPSRVNGSVSEALTYIGMSSSSLPGARDLIDIAADVPGVECLVGGLSERRAQVPFLPVFRESSLGLLREQTPRRGPRSRGIP